MKKYAILSFILIAFLCMACACVNNSDNQKESQNTGLFEDPVALSSQDNETQTNMLLEDAVSKFRIAADTESPRNEDITYYLSNDGIPAAIHQIIGAGVDKEGTADSWMFGIKYGENTSLVYPYNTWWVESIWPGPLPEDEIDTDAIIMPSEILRMNKGYTDTLFERSNTGKISIVLAEGVYYFTPEQSENISEIKFSAYSGEVIA